MVILCGCAATTLEKGGRGDSASPEPGETSSPDSGGEASGDSDPPVDTGTGEDTGTESPPPDPIDPSSLTSEPACGPWAAISVGRSWTWETDAASSGCAASQTQTIESFDGVSGTLISEYEEYCYGYLSIQYTVSFHCDNGLYLDEWDKYSYYSAETWSSSSYDTIADEPILAWPIELAVGDMWTEDYSTMESYNYGEYSPQGPYELDSEVVSEETISSVLGDFSALKIEGGRVGYYFSRPMWVTENLGMVRLEVRGYELSLVAFEP